MKNFYKKGILTFILTFSFLVFVKAQALEDVVNSIRSANVAGVTHYLDNFVTITLSNTQSVYSKTQADLVLKDFFSKNTVKDFSVIQSGASGNNSKFAIGNLTTNNGQYRLYVLMKPKDDSYVLQEIRFEK